MESCSVLMLEDGRGPTSHEELSERPMAICWFHGGSSSSLVAIDASAFSCCLGAPPICGSKAQLEFSQLHPGRRGGWNGTEWNVMAGNIFPQPLEYVHGKLGATSRHSIRSSAGIRGHSS